MEEAVEIISVDFHLDKEGKVVDVTPTGGKAKRSEGDPPPQYAWASAVHTAKQSPGCFYIWLGRWIRICV